MYEQSFRDELDRATRARLARLASMPVDTTNLERRLQAALAQETGRPAAVKFPRGLRGIPLWRPLTSLAAALLGVAVMLGVLLSGTTTSPVIAAPADLARIHEALNAHTAMAIPVANIEEANRVIASQWSKAPALPIAPAASPEQHIHACCLGDLKDRKVVCVLMHEKGNVPITMVIARAQDVKLSPDGATVERNGRKYRVHDANGLRMVMTEGNGKYVCLMGNVPLEQLLEVAAGLSL